MRIDKKAFQKKVWKHYKEQGRHTLPWRHTRDPYKILVSEIMLQQTQVDRVLPKYKAFMKAFPSRSVLAKASLTEVLNYWQGLGYNRRARFLWQAVQKPLPKTIEELKKLPGVGPYTATAVAIFAFDARAVCIETNIRTVFIHEFFSDKKDIPDKEITSLVEQTLPQGSLREWYYALMDYGSFLKKQVPNPSRRSAMYVRQSTFRGSRREARGVILKKLLRGEKLLVASLTKLEQEALSGLVKDGLVSTNGSYVKIKKM